MTLWIWMVPNQLTSLPPLNLINPHNSLVMLWNRMPFSFKKGKVEQRFADMLPRPSWPLTTAEACSPRWDLVSQGHFITGKGENRPILSDMEFMFFLSPRQTVLQKLRWTWTGWGAQRELGGQCTRLSVLESRCRAWFPAATCERMCFLFLLFLFQTTGVMMPCSYIIHSLLFG